MDFTSASAVAHLFLVRPVGNIIMMSWLQPAHRLRYAAEQGSLTSADWLEPNPAK